MSIEIFDERVCISIESYLYGILQRSLNVIQSALSVNNLCRLKRTISDLVKTGGYGLESGYYCRDHYVFCEEVVADVYCGYIYIYIEVCG